MQRIVHINAAETLGEIPIPVHVTAEDEHFAVLAVVVHAAEEWPAGPVCRNERVPHPCRLHRWGREVLRRRGLSDARVEELAARTRADLSRRGARR
ncbi:hypothetical protein SAMN05444365_103137 [Micromonospora pattaloongensis]|uniref:Uncharacterized protein n=1 Tax=Micromonospora pattaloongensis TaxID=405436 RepID=A0A1H3LYE2_9ACTN|nr:hypothetical protein [Micromonospora pattaloongensis]SDY69044.1 hypothetical protein SAMN05444365_103137 [Micromonospora pattaloongensis]